MLFATPKPSKALASQLRELDTLRARLGDATGVVGPWLGQLRRQVRASTMQSSVSIEGFIVPAGEGARIVAGDDPRAFTGGYDEALDRDGALHRARAHLAA